MKVELHRGRAGWRWPLLIVLCLTSLGLQAQNTPDIDPALLIDEEEQVTQEELEMENIPVDERIFIEPWNEVPYNRAYFTYTDAEIREKWDYLMRGLRMPYPSADYLRRQFEKYPFLRDGLEDFDGDFQSLEGRYVNVWRHFFAGNFQTARRLGLELGPIGEIPALFSQLLYAIYLADRQSVKYMMLQDMANRTERYFDLMEPAEDDPETVKLLAKLGKKCPGCGGFVERKAGCRTMMCGTNAHGKIADALRNGGCALIFDWQSLTQCNDGHGYTGLDGKFRRGAGPKTNRQVLMKGYNDGKKYWPDKKYIH